MINQTSSKVLQSSSTIMTAMKHDFLSISPSMVSKTPAVQNTSQKRLNPFNTLDRSPVRPKVKTLKEMEHKDLKRY